MSADSDVTRRDWLFGPLQRLSAAWNSPPVPRTGAGRGPCDVDCASGSADRLNSGRTAAANNLVAIVQGRFCLALRSLACSTCVERCPVEGAMRLERNIPVVNPDLCTGCGICKDVCPAPKNAILLVPARAKTIVVSMEKQR